MPHIKELELDVRDNCYPSELTIPSTILSAKSLSVLSLVGFSLMPLLNLDIKFTSLRTMHLGDALLNDNIMQWLILGCPLLEDLRLFSCDGIKIVYVSGLSKLKQLTVNNVGFDKLEIDSPGLQNLDICIPHGKCKVNISTCACLKKLQLDGDFITDQWLSFLVSRCAFLEDLYISYAGALENLNITSNTLKSLTLENLDMLVEVEINAPLLQKFNFLIKGHSPTRFPTCLLNASHMLEVQLVLGFFGIMDLYYDRLTQFLANFNHFKTIELSGPFDKIFIPKEKRENLVSSLDAIKHLVLFRWGKSMEFPSAELLEYMLWLCPRAESLWIKAGGSSLWIETETEILLKLRYEDNVCGTHLFLVASLSL